MPHIRILRTQTLSLSNSHVLLKSLAALTKETLAAEGAFNLCATFAFDTELALQRRTPGRRLQSTAVPEPPPAGGHLPSIATSSYLRSTRDISLRTPDIRWVDGDGGDSGSMLAGRETRKMNLYQAVRDAMA